MKTFEIRHEWVDDPEMNDWPEFNNTMAIFSVWVNGKCFTRSMDKYSAFHDVPPDWVEVGERDDLVLPMYPLASWLGWNLYRILYEPRCSHDYRKWPITDAAESFLDDMPEEWVESGSWSVAHELEAGVDGGGYIWPSITLEPDSEEAMVRISSRPRAATENFPLDMLSDETETVERPALALEVMRFIDSVCERMKAKNVEEGNLAEGEVFYIRDLLKDDAEHPGNLVARKDEARQGYDLNHMRVEDEDEESDSETSDSDGDDLDATPTEEENGL